MKTMHAMRGLAAALLLAVSPLLAVAAEACQPLMIQGDPVACACSAAGWGHFQKSLAALREVQDKPALSALVRTWLCASGEPAARSLYRQMPRRIVLNSWGTGEGESSEVVDREQVLPLGGAAWDIGVSLENDQLLVSFAPNEACIHTGIFARKAGSWLLVGLGAACD